MMNATGILSAGDSGHSRRVAAFTIAIAKSTGMPKEQITIIATGAYLHDIGKIKIPEAILTKDDKLTSAEYERMQEHAYIGYKLVSNIPVVEEAAEIVYAHHESYDGTGYPRSLRGPKIPLGARIVAVANTLDSITSDLPYRRKRSLTEAKAEIRRCSGTQFDPQIVEVFLSIPDGVWSELMKAVDESAG